MEVSQLDQQLSVSGQLVKEDVAALAAQGIGMLECNRPDNESEGQPSFDDIKVVGEAAGLEVVNIPFAGGQMQPEQVEAFAQLLATGKRIHAYCRTGNRSSKIWTAAKEA